MTSNIIKKTDGPRYYVNSHENIKDNLCSYVHKMSLKLPIKGTTNLCKYRGQQVKWYHRGEIITIHKVRHHSTKNQISLLHTASMENERDKER